MKIIKLILLSVIFVIGVGSHGMVISDDILTKTCQELNGNIVYNWKCPYSGDLRTQAHCMVLDDESRPMYFNGCSGAIGNYGTIFFQACVYHDLCYHHEPASTGLQREDCDSKFYNNMFEICEKQYPHDSNCKSSARWFYNAVATFGKNAWICSKEKANYPHGALWLQQLVSLK